MSENQENQESQSNGEYRFLLAFAFGPFDMCNQSRLELALQAFRVW